MRSSLRKRRFMQLTVAAVVFEACLVGALIAVTPNAGPHHTGFWLLVLAQAAGVAVAAAIVVPLRAQLSPLVFECAYYSVVFLIQFALLEILVAVFAMRWRARAE